MNRATPLLAAYLAAAFAPGWIAAAEVPAPVLQAEQQRIAAIAKAAKTAISVFAGGGQGGGSGVVITPDGYALSNFHVAKPSGDYMQCSMADGELYDAIIVSIDPTGDVALIKLLGRDNFPCAQLADSDTVQVGDWCFAVGNPFLLATDFQPTVTYGIISGVHRYQPPAGTLLEYADCLQTDASINPGNSGGPLFNADGDLIGINGRCSFEKRGRVNVGVGYAISVNQIKNFLGYLRSGRIVDHATLGATVTHDEDGRVVVSDILETSDVYRRGLRYGDEILAFAGRKITTVNGFKNILGTLPKGWRVPLSYRHEGQQRDVFVRLMGVHTHDELIKKAAGNPPLPEKPQPGKPKPSPPREQPDDQPADKPGDKPGSKPEDRPEAKPAGKPADKPDGKPTLKPSGKPQLLPRKLPVRPALTPLPIPKHIEPLIKKRPGYANYYFNELNRDRVWKAFLAHGSFGDRPATWRLTGQATGGHKVEIVLGEKEVAGTFGPESAKIDLSTDLAEQLAPRGSGGLLVALHLWQRLLQLGPAQFGDVYYLGTVPVIDRPGLCDALVATHNVVETRFLFDPQSGLLIGMEMFPENDTDPCEVYFDDFRAVDNRQLPHRLRIRHGDSIYAEIQLATVRWD
jgi:S1-C subfamily serine protease